MNTLQTRLAELGHTLPELSPPAANYLNYRHQDGVLVISGQIGAIGSTAAGPVGAGVDVPAARAEAQAAALKVLAVLNAALDGELSRLRQLMRVGVFVAAAPGFTEHSAVADGASDLFVAVLGERGRHARAAVGVASLPAGAAVEVEAWVALAS